MNEELPDEPKTDDGSAILQAPVVILPSPNTQGIMGGLESTTSTISPVSPQPFIAPFGTGGGENLASSVEQAIADDGRFDGFASGLAISANDGVVALSGLVPSEGQRQSLLAEVRGVPGVRDVQDGLRIG